MRFSQNLAVACLFTLSCLGCSSSTRGPEGALGLTGETYNAQLLLDPSMPDPGPMSHDMAHKAAFYFPNRILDLLDVARFGVDIGPGIGFDGCVTHYMRLAAMTRTSAGLGYQTFRHSPTKFGHEEYVVSGPQTFEVGLGNNWYQHMWDTRLELHLLIVGAHVAVNFAEIGDFFVGFAMFDPMNDDH